MSNCTFDLRLCGEGLASRPRICCESDAESLQIGIVCRTGFLHWRDKRCGKPCVCDDAIEGEKSSSQANTPEYDRTSDRMDPLSQGDQAGNARDYQREQTHRYQHSEGDDYFPRARILGGGGFHDSLSLLCIRHGALQSKRGKPPGCLDSPRLAHRSPAIAGRRWLASRCELTRSHAKQMVAICEAKRAIHRTGKQWPSRDRKLLKLS